MGLVLRQVIGYQQGRRASPLTAPKDNPLLKKQLDQVQKDLNLILNKWKFGDAPLNSAQEFLNSFEPWINRQIKEKEELKSFLEEQGASNLNNLKETWKNTEADYLRRIKELREGGGSSEEIKELEQSRQELQKEVNELKKDNKQQEETIIGLNNSYDKLDKKFERSQAESQRSQQELQELKASKGTNKLSEADKEKLSEYEDLVAERDEAIREKKTLEQDLLATNNRLNLKQQEVNNKDTALEKLKKEKNQLEVNQQKALKEKNSLITTLNQEIKQHKEKYSKQSKFLETEQLEWYKKDKEWKDFLSKCGVESFERLKQQINLKDQALERKIQIEAQLEAENDKLNKKVEELEKKLALKRGGSWADG